MFALRNLFTQQRAITQPFNGVFSAFFGTIKPFKLPDLGEKIKEATVKKVYVKEGDIVEETIADVATDKMFTQIPSPFAGKVHKVFHKEEDTCLVGELFLEIELEDGTVASTSNTSNSSSSANKSQVEQKQSCSLHESKEKSQSAAVSSEDGYSNNEYVLATPSVRAIAREHKISLKNIKGTGKDGRIMKSDINDYLANKSNSSATTNQTTAKKQQPSTTASSLSSSAPSAKTTIKMTDFQKGMQKSMTESNTIPHLYLKDEYDLTNLTQLRETIKQTQNQSITFMTFFIKAFSLALHDFPLLNSLYDITKPFEYTLVSSHNISLAIDSPKGLVVPNIKNVQNLSILDIQRELKRLVKEGEQGTLGPKDLFDGSICISNIGTIGGTYTGPLILPPQTTIVGLGRVQTLPRYINKSAVKGVEDLHLMPRKIMNASFGCDHRVIDGATVTKFSNKWRSYLEEPTTMLLHLK